MISLHFPNCRHFDGHVPYKSSNDPFSGRALQFLRFNDTGRLLKHSRIGFIFRLSLRTSGHFEIEDLSMRR